ncbi:class I SAM-dependent methyltransferase [Azonexus hydrophilus]|uniref:Class I SAM-dependent methyltransferase n=1 Tax=Azonexus hydrophilus TaxID=418702 RepID=A0ABZ2XGD6_9RHOO
MANSPPPIDHSYERFYAQRNGLRVYPTEFVVRTFLAKYPKLNFRKPVADDRVLDIAFGDGRNTVFLCDQGYAVSGIEITEGIVSQTGERLEKLGHQADLRVGRNSKMPYENDYFDYLLACHCCYYCDEGETFADNMKEYARVMKPGAWLVASVASRESYIFKDAITLEDGSLRIQADPYGNRDGYRLHAFTSKDEIEAYLSPWFEHFSFGFADNDFFGVSERLFWVVCQKREGS